jgi:hypothetical protein
MNMSSSDIHIPVTIFTEIYKKNGTLMIQVKYKWIPYNQEFCNALGGNF